jgi:uncharacterized protein (TIGR02246 family)
MQDDERAIRDLIANWGRATEAGDLERLLPLMAENVVFLVTGQPPMRGRAAFAAGFRTAQQHHRIESRSDVQEIRVAGEWAYCWNYLEVTMTPVDGGTPLKRAGYTLTILRREAGGGWVLFRDANLLQRA